MLFAEKRCKGIFVYFWRILETKKEDELNREKGISESLEIIV